MPWIVRKTSLENVRVMPNDDLALNLRRKKTYGSDQKAAAAPTSTGNQRYSYAGTSGSGGIGVKAVRPPAEALPEEEEEDADDGEKSARYDRMHVV